MRSRVHLFALLLVACSLALPLSAQAGGIPFFGPIIPAAYNVCPGSWGLLVTVINNIISLLITLAIVFVAPMMIAWAGFLMVFSPTKVGDVSKARSILLNTVIGIVIALAGWLIVDAIMAVLYNPKAVGSTWSALIGSGGIEPCIDLKGSLNQTKSGTPITGVSATGALGSPPAGKTGTACDPAVVKAAAAAGGYELSPMQANIFACIAAPESSCGSNLQNYAWNTGVPGKPGSTAYGAFQVLLKTNSSCYENPACVGAVGLGMRDRLSCASGFDNVGNPIPNSPVVQRCIKAASNIDCSASAAACLLQKNKGDFSPWQKDINSARQTGCITSGT